RLFRELEVRNRDLTESLDRQTATSEILRAISSSPTDLQPVFDTIIRSAVRLCDATFGGLHRYDGHSISFDGHANISPEAVERWQREIFPYRPTRDRVIGRAVLDRVPVHVHDIQSESGYVRPGLGSTAFRTGLAVPMLKGAECIGVLGLWRSDVRPFTDS